jgi:hypothetical protein
MNVSLKWIARCAILSVCLLGFAVLADEAKSGRQTEDVSLWYRGNQLALKTRDDGKKFKADWAFSISDGGDVRLLKHETKAGAREDGELVMLSSGVMLIRGFEVEKGWEVGALDGPALAMQLALKLLHLAFPGGPETVGENSTILLQESDRSVRVATPTADGMLMAPWVVEGTASRQPGGEIVFDMVARARQLSGGDVSPLILPMAGTWMRSPEVPRLPDSMSLEGWRVFLVTLMSSPLRGQRELVSGELASEAGFHRLGQLRQAIADAEKAGRRD